MYGVDVGDAALMESRSGRWLDTLIEGLLTRPVSHDLAGQPVFSCRIQAAIFGPVVAAEREGAAR